MRIIGGTLGGRIFPDNKKLKARPTTDKAKEALFNILNSKIDFEGITVLDLFSGTGSIGLEFFSRGTKNVTIVEKRYEHSQYIKKLNQLFSANLHIITADVFKFIKHTNKTFDLIFADPPYEHPQFEEILPLIRDTNIIKKDGLFILEHGPNKDFSKEKEFLETRKYGKVHFSFFKFSL